MEEKAEIQNELVPNHVWQLKSGETTADAHEQLQMFPQRSERSWPHTRLFSPGLQFQGKKYPDLLAVKIEIVDE